MRYRSDDGFQYIKTLHDSFLIIETDRLNQIIDHIYQNNIDSIFISRWHGYRLNDLKPFLDMSFIKKIEFMEGLDDADGHFYENQISIEGIENFHNLTHLRLDYCNVPVDFCQFPCLESLRIVWNSKMRNLEDARNLRFLYIEHHKSKKKDLQDIPCFENLEELSLTFSNAITLEGLKHYPHLKKLELEYCMKLVEIKDILAVKGSLESLRISFAKRIKDYEVVADLPLLKTFGFSNCGEIKDLYFLNKMRNLINFMFVSTNVINGDLSPLLDKRFNFIGSFDKRHYSHKMKYIKEFIHDK